MNLNLFLVLITILQMKNSSLRDKKDLKEHKELNSSSYHSYLNDVGCLINTKFGTPYSNDLLYLISLQGPTSSGKSAFSDMLKDILEKDNVYLMRLDDFYNMPSGSQEHNEELDFDNPAMLNWCNIYSVINSIIRRDSTIPVYKRDKEVTYINNCGINIVIIEGLYSFNCMNAFTFNIKEFDACNSAKIIDNEYVKNDNVERLEGIKEFKNKELTNFKDLRCLNIRLTMCLDKIMSLRIKRDKILRGLSKDMVSQRINKFVWPATLKWVYSEVFTSDIDVIHGNFNKEGTRIILKCLKNYFLGNSYIDDTYNNFFAKIKLSNEDLCDDYMSDCSKECHLKNSKLTL